MLRFDVISAMSLSIDQVTALDYVCTSAQFTGKKPSLRPVPHIVELPKSSCPSSLSAR